MGILQEDEKNSEEIYHGNTATSVRWLLQYGSLFTPFSIVHVRTCMSLVRELFLPFTSPRVPEHNTSVENL